MKSTTSLFVFVGLVLQLITAQDENIVSKVGALRSGAYKYFFDASVEDACDTVLLMNVGTAMSVKDYDIIATDIVKDQKVTVIIGDHNPRFPVKLFSNGFKKYYNEMIPSLQRIVPSCKDTKDPMILVGGHSASGKAVVEALPNLDSKPAGFVGLDPFPIKERKMKIDDSIAVLTWGLEKTTCRAKVQQTAKAAYNIASSDRRVFFRVDNMSQKIQHCVFTDGGCAVICGKGKSGVWVPPAVGKSIEVFIASIKKDSFVKEEFANAASGGNFDLFVGNDDPDGKVATA